jgi:hypothetical protein
MIKVTSSLFGQTTETVPVDKENVSAFELKNCELSKIPFSKENDSEESEVDESNGQKSSLILSEINNVAQVEYSPEAITETKEARKGSRKSNFFKISLKNQKGKRSVKLATFSTKIKNKCSVRLIINHKSNNNDISEVLEKMIKAYFTEYFYHLSEEVSEICGKLDNLINLRRYLIKNKQKLKIVSIALSIYENFGCLLTYFKKEYKNSYTIEQLIELSEEYPDCSGLEYTRNFVKVEISTWESPLNQVMDIEDELNIIEDINQIKKEKF